MSGVAPQTLALAPWGDAYPAATPEATLPTALFYGHGEAAAAAAAAADDPVTSEDAAWRSS